MKKLIVLLIVLLILPVSNASVKVGFNNDKSPKVEIIPGLTSASSLNVNSSNYWDDYDLPENLSDILVPYQNQTQDLEMFDYDIYTKDLFVEQAADPANPDISFGTSPDAPGLYSSNNGIIAFSFYGAASFVVGGSNLKTPQTRGAYIMNEVASATNPVYTFQSNQGDGLGTAGSGQVALIVDSTQVINLTKEGGAPKTNIYGNITMYNPSDLNSYTIFDQTSGGNLFITTTGTGTNFNNQLIANEFQTTNSNFTATENSILLNDFNTYFQASNGEVKVGFDPLIETNLSVYGKIKLPTENNPTKPSLAFGDGDTGMYEATDNELRIASNGALKMTISPTLSRLAVDLRSAQGTAYPAVLFAEQPSATNPVLIPKYSDIDTGIGSNTDNQLSLIAGGVEGMRITEANSKTNTTIFGDTNVTGNLSGQNHYGNMYYFDEEEGGNSIISLPATDIYANITSYTRSNCYGIICDTTTGNMTIDSAGVYKIDFSISFAGAANSEYHIAMFKNNQQVNSTHAQRYTTGSAIGSMSFTAIEKLDKGDILNIRIEDETNPANDPTLHYHSWSVHRISN